MCCSAHLTFICSICGSHLMDPPPCCELQKELWRFLLHLPEETELSSEKNNISQTMRNSSTDGVFACVCVRTHLGKAAARRREGSLVKHLTEVCTVRCVEEG